MSFSIIISVGKYGGFYIAKSIRTEIPGYEIRICLGWIAVSLLNPEFDEYISQIGQFVFGKDEWNKKIPE
jgi:hypothetical protein